MATALYLRCIFRAAFGNPLLNADYSCRMPFTAGWRGYLALVQCRGDSARGSATELGEDRTQLLGAFLGLIAVRNSFRVKATQLDPLGFLRRQRVLRATRNHGALFLSQR